MNLLDIGLVAIGLVLLIAGGEALVRGASTLAGKARIPPLVIGLVVVSAATSAPEFAVTVGAAISGAPDLAIGNVIGSNIANILLILGVAALISPLVIQRQLVRFDMPVMLGVTLLLLVVSLDGVISRLDGILLFGVLAGHTILSVILGKRFAQAPGYKPAELPLNTKPVPLWLAMLLLIAGIGLLVLGAQTLVNGAVSIATSLGVSSLVVGLTVVAIGTSLPELATSIVAIRRGETDMAVGNIVGSNIFNIGLVLGLPAFILPNGIPVIESAVAIDYPLMIAAAAALVPIAFTGFKIARWEGGLFLTLYIGYLTYLVLDNTDHDATQGFTNIMLWLVLPLVASTLIAVTSYEIGVIRTRRSLAAQAPDFKSN
jgi:cation:H+ antiporter